MRSILSATALATAAILVPAPGIVGDASAQEDALGGTIRSIEVEGNRRIEARTVLSYMLLEPGDRFDAQRIDLSLKTLFATGLFTDVAIDRRGTDLIVRVVENPIINRVLFEGNRALDDEKFREEIQAAPRGIFTAARVQADVQRILELYRQSGRFSATVEPEYKPLDQNRVDLIFKMTEGPVTGVRAINFIGNQEYSDSRLRGEIVTKQSRLWRFFSSNDNYDPGRLEFDREQLRQFYQNNGFYDFRVVSAVADLTPDREDFYITFTVEEGEPYSFGEVRVETALDKLDGERLTRSVPIQKGELYRGNRIEDTIDALTFAAGVSGYAFVDIRPQIQANPETNTIDVVFAIDEGPRVYVERIDIVGNTRTLDRVVRRELRFAEGDAFNRVLLDRSRNRVRALGLFREVELTETPGSTADRTVVEVNVEEDSTGELSFAAGFSSVENFLLDFSVVQRNLRGAGQSAVGRLSFSDTRQTIDLRFTEPRFLDRNLAAGIDLFATRTDFLRFADFESETIGAGVRVGFPITERTNLGLRYRIQSDQLNLAGNVLIDEDGTVFPTQFGTRITDEFNPDPALFDVVNACDPAVRLGRDPNCEERGLTSLVGYTFNWDRRNDPIIPTGGFDMSFSQDVAGVGGDVQYLETELTGAWYRGLFGGLRLSQRLSGGYIFPFGDDDIVRINNRFFRGGNSFRGFDVAGLGPREILKTVDADGNETGFFRRRSQGGNVYYQATSELEVPNFLPEEYGIRTSLFLEAGSLGELDDRARRNGAGGLNRVIELDDGTSQVIFIDDGLGLRATAGLSVAWRSPFGPIRFDFSRILRRERFDETQIFRFSTSTSF
ncbi:MAG: outer membrane protein assembly factor BamA [Pseudomonadota bacterium]